MEDGSHGQTTTPERLKPSNNGDPTTIPTIVDFAHNLRDLLFEIPLPKTRNTKMAPITLEALHRTQDLITSVATLLHEHPRESNLSNISKQLDVITTHLGTLNVAQVAQPSPPKTQSYASVLATGIQCLELLNDPCEGNTETRPLVYRDSLRQGEPNRCDTLTQW